MARVVNKGASATVFHSELILQVQAAIAQYLASCSRHGLAVPAGLHLLSVDVALLRGHKHQVSCTQGNTHPAALVQFPISSLFVRLPVRLRVHPSIHACTCSLIYS